jgi:GNAT superfamily N-acetyltransferase
MTGITIRPAGLSDAHTIAEIHVRAWRWAYRGLMPDELLDGLSVEQRERMWEQNLSPEGPTNLTFVADGEDGVVGFVATGPSQDPDATLDTGEVYAIYLEPAVVGTGVGRQLFSRATESLRAAGYRVATLWVLDTNERTRRFYEAAGWRPDGEAKMEPWGKFNLREVRYRIGFGAGEC